MLKLIAVICFIITLTQCATFGDDNSYTCHCITEDEQCNKDTGMCSGGGCAAGWYGVSCQKQNVALGKESSQVDNNGDRTSNLAVDGDITANVPNKCSDTSSDGTGRWWRVDLKEEYPIKHITIYYQSYPLSSLLGFSLHVNKEDKEPELCYKDNTFRTKSLNNIECNQVITGRYVNISNLHSNGGARFLVLCEVEIYVCSVGTFGSECNEFCHCLYNERCLETGVCSSGCADGWTGTTCSQRSTLCSVGKFGSDCSKFCHCLNNERCSESGQCPGRCADGWTGTTCSQECISGRYGEGCSNQCSINCKISASCNHINGKCNDGCTAGYTDAKCIKKCTGGFYGDGCQKNCGNRKCLNNLSCDHVGGKCIGGCSDGYILPDCSKACDNGMYGAECLKLCSTRNCIVETSPCNNINGSCEGDCKEGFVGIDCVKGCDEGFYGVGCSKKCSDRKCKDSNSQCDSKTGECIAGCQLGYQSIDCIQACNNGTYGAGCLNLCTERNCLVETSSCHHITGSCQGGCKEGFVGIDCVKGCEEGVYGAGCSKKCSERNCLVETSPCNNINGSCEGECKEGFIGIDCVKGCEEGFYGVGCSKKCSERKCKDNNLQCDSKTGKCIDGCQQGYQSIDCTQECDNGTYGQDCQFNCSARFCQPQDKDKCSYIDGACDCLDGFEGVDCAIKQSIVGGTGDSDTTIIAAVVSACVVLIIIAVIVVLIIRRRRTPPPVNDKTSDKVEERNIAVVKPQVQGPIYENSDAIREESVARVAVEPVRNVYQNEPIPPTEALQPSEAVQEAEAALVPEADPATETTSMTESEISPYLMPEKSDFNLAELEEFVNRTKPNDGFDPLYKGLPDTFTSSYDISHLPENRKKNRFKGYYPYDATRVVLVVIADDPHSDYINANFLNGYDGNKFIASQGATRVNQNDFVRMIWDMKCDKVVMVTREFEGGKRKCERYWPEVGSETFGVIKLTLKEETYRANYTKRHIVMERDGMTHEFSHFHYISWPDHGVPETNDLLDFQFIVNKFKPESTSPVLVHCSAGIGRTGTYIAIDYCLKQYNDIGKVDVLQCVKTQRQQRKGMVQTTSQLQFVHEALIEGIKRGDTAMYKHIFESEFDKHASKIRMGNMSLTQQFSYLKTVENNQEETANNKHIVSDRTQLYRFPSHTLEFGIYFEELRNVEPNDVWKGIFQNDAKVTIFILDNTNSVAVCPDIGTEETRGDLVIENKSEDNICPTLNVANVSVKTQGHPELRMNVLISSIDKSGIKPIVLYKHILDIIENMEIYQNDLQPIFIFTSDSQFSRIFCIIHNIVQRIRLDNEVEIFKAVRKMHRRIGKVIKSQEEYNALHAIVAEYVKSRNIYANL